MKNEAAFRQSADCDAVALSMGSEDETSGLHKSGKRVRRWLLIALICTIASILFASVMYVMLDMMEHVRPNPLLLFLWWATRFYLWAGLAPAVAYSLKRIPLQPIAASRIFLHVLASLMFSLVYMVLHLSLATVFIGSRNSFWRFLIPLGPGHSQFPARSACVLGHSCRGACNKPLRTL